MKVGDSIRNRWTGGYARVVDEIAGEYGLVYDGYEGVRWREKALVERAFVVDNERAFASRSAGSAVALRVHYAPLEKRFEEALRRYGR